jgi:hypothetical protein
MIVTQTVGLRCARSQTEVGRFELRVKLINLVGYPDRERTSWYQNRKR